FDADIVAPTRADIGDVGRARLTGIPDHGGAAAAGGDVDGPLEAGVAQDVVPCCLCIDPVAATRITRITQVPVALLHVGVTVIELVQVGQAVQPGDIHL